MSQTMSKVDSQLTIPESLGAFTEQMSHLSHVAAKEACQKLPGRDLKTQLLFELSRKEQGNSSPMADALQLMTLQYIKIAAGFAWGVPMQVQKVEGQILAVLAEKSALLPLCDVFVSFIDLDQINPDATDESQREYARACERIAVRAHAKFGH